MRKSEGHTMGVVSQARYDSKEIEKDKGTQKTPGIEYSGSPHNTNYHLYHAKENRNRKMRRNPLGWTSTDAQAAVWSTDEKDAGTSVSPDRGKVPTNSYVAHSMDKEQPDPGGGSPPSTEWTESVLLNEVLHS